MSLTPPGKILYADDTVSLVICPLELSHAELLYKAVEASKEKLQVFMEWAHFESSVESQRERILLAEEKYAQGLGFEFVVFDALSHSFLMCASLHSGKTLNRRALEVGYWTATEHCNRGLATLVTKILLVAAFDCIGCDRVEIGCNQANESSLRVIQKCNFHLEGEVRNYFHAPTEEMLAHGYHPSRVYLQHALIPADIPTLAWYPIIQKHTCLVSRNNDVR